MSATQAAVPAVPMARTGRSWRPPWYDGPRGSDVNWAIAFLVPYVAMLAAFVLYPIGFAFWLGGTPAHFVDLFAYPHFVTMLVNTVLLAGVGVNIMLFLAFLLSGFFILPGRWIKGMLVVYMLPWALPALPANLSLHWMLIGYGGFLNTFLYDVFGIEAPIWFNTYWSAMAANILAYIWKWMPFWTLVFLAGRMAIPQDVYDAAAVDGAKGLKRFTFVTFPLLANLYLVSALLATLWAAGDFVTTYFVSAGAPALETEVLATYSFRMALDWGYVELGVAAALSALPLLIPLAILLIRRLQATEVQL